jgi:hypothetical protein
MIGFEQAAVSRGLRADDPDVMPGLPGRAQPVNMTPWNPSPMVLCASIRFCGRAREVHPAQLC